MLLKVDHYTALAQAVARLQRDSYELRGAIYDRALTHLARSLYSADPPIAQADIEMEFLAFREAVRRVEFGDLDDLDWLTERSEPAPSQPPPPPAPEVSSYAAPATNRPDRRADPRGNRVAVSQRQRSVGGRVVRRMVFALLFIGLGFAGYSYAMGQLDLSPLARLLDRIVALEWLGGRSGLPAQASERAIYYEQGGALAGSREFAGKALWSTRSEAAERGQKPELVLTLDVQVPERGFSLSLSIRRDASVGAVMSHLIEFKFVGSNDFAIDTIASVTGLILKGVEDKSGAALSGLSVRVAPGIFLFGLSADKDDMRRNVELLRTQSQMEIAIAFGNGRTGTLSVDKGPSGQRAFDDAFKQWAQ